MQKKVQKEVYSPVVLAIIFDTKNKKILIGKKKSLSWAFPGGKPELDEELEEALKREVKEETDLDVENVGVIFAGKFPEKKDIFGIYFLCEIVGGKLKPNEEFIETKWISPKELKKYNTSLNPKLIEYLEGLSLD